MNKHSQLVYDFREHGIYSIPDGENVLKKSITLTIDTLQFECDYYEGKIVNVKGYLPLFKAKESIIDIPELIEKEFVIELKNVEPIIGVAYNLFKFFPKSEKYFMQNELPIVAYDKSSKRILMGNSYKSKDSVKVTNNIICSADKEGNLCSVLLLLDEIIYE